MSIKNEKCIEFSLGADYFALPLGLVKEVMSKKTTTPIPNAPSYNLGIINVRGTIVSIIDLRKKLKIESKPKEEAVIIIELNNSLVGLVVDSINRVFKFEEEKVSVAPEIGSDLNNKYVEAIYQNEDHLTVILSINEIFQIVNDLNPSKEVA